MTWDPVWAARAKSSNRSPVWLVETVPVPGAAAPARFVSSAPWPYHIEALLVDECSISHGSIQFPSMQVSGSACSLAMQPGAVAIEGILQGTIVRVSVALGDRVEPVFVGALRNVTESTQGPTVWDVQGLEVSLFGRYLAGSGTRKLFAGTGETGVCSFAYAPGDPTFSHTSTLLTLRAGSSGFRALHVTPTTGSPFYLVGTGNTGAAMTGCLAGGALDTTVVDVEVGDEIRSVAFDAGHPLDFLVHALDPDDTTWPDEWRIGIPGDVFDTARTETEVNRHGLKATGPQAVQVITPNPVDSFGEWIAPVLSACGAVLVQRQGQIVGRILYGPAGLSGETVTDDEIVVASVSHWPSWTGAEILRVTDRSAQPGVPVVPADIVSDGPGGGDPWSTLVYVHHLLGLDPPPPPTSAGSPDTLAANFTGHGVPVKAEAAIRAPLFGGSPGFITSSAGRDAWRADIASRLGPWFTERPEVVTITLPGWRPETIGDGLVIDSERMRSSAPDTDALRGAVGLIISGGPDFFGSSTTYTVLVVPDGAAT